MALMLRVAGGLIVHVTPLFEGSLATVAENCCVVLMFTPTGVGVTVTEITPRIVSIAEPDFVGSATLIAVTFTVAGFGTAAGDVY